MRKRRRNVYSPEFQPKQTPGPRYAGLVFMGLGAAAIIGTILLVSKKASAQPQPAPLPPAPTPPAPSGNPAIAGVLNTGKSYTFSLQSSLAGNSVGNALAAADITGAIVTCLSGGICTGSFVWQGADGAPLPQPNGIIWISVMPTLTGLGQPVDTAPGTYSSGAYRQPSHGPVTWPAPAPPPIRTGPRCPPGLTYNANTDQCEPPAQGGGVQYGGAGASQSPGPQHHRARA